MGFSFVGKDNERATGGVCFCGIRPEWQAKLDRFALDARKARKLAQRARFAPSGSVFALDARKARKLAQRARFAPSGSVFALDARIVAVPIRTARCLAYGWGKTRKLA
jgi:hypothetical protein